MNLEAPVLIKESLNNTITSASEINIDFLLSSPSNIDFYGDINIILGASLPQSGNVYYTVTDIVSGKKFSYYRYI